ncbi:MAG: TIGR02147 family protein [Chitinispirillaceae bacterium]|nr:TIGR02147 family protein [Chitinispirillaceae bacterium]
MIDIAQYMDYRRYLGDYYLAVKKHNSRFSFQAFSEKAGISSKGLLYNVLKGKRHLSKSHLAGMARALGLNKHEFAYFETLFAYNCAKKASDCKFYLERLTSIRTTGRTAWRPQVVRKEQYEYYSRWYHSVVRSLIGMYGFSGDYQALARLCYPAVTPGQARKSVELLLSLGFISKDATGSYRLTERTITTEPEVIGVAVHSFHQQSGKLAVAALKELPRHRRNFSGVTIGISENMYREICNDIEEFRTHLLRKIETDQCARITYQMNIQFFPVSRDPDVKGGRRL